MFTAKVLRRVLIPAAAVVAEKAKSDCCCKPSELPIYSYDPPTVKPDICEEPSALEQQFQDMIGTLRKNVFQVMGTIKNVKEMGEDYVGDGLTTVMCYIECLQEDDSTTPKYGAIAIGGLTGLVLGLRGGFFKRTLYTSVGALSMAALCYPKEANEYSKILLEEAQRYFVIGYNFIYGVKKGDPPVELPSLPTLPTSLSDAWSSAKGLITKSSVALPVTDNPQLNEDSDEKK